MQRGHVYAIVDEVDSILIDEARTPLIISGPLEDRADLYIAVDELMKPLVAEHDKIEKELEAAHGKEKAQGAAQDRGPRRARREAAPGLPHRGRQRARREDAEASRACSRARSTTSRTSSLVHHVNQALKAHKLFQRDRDYIVKGGEVVIIDEFTGRMMQGRRYSEGLHQALEAKEHVEIQPENQTLASITFQNYFRLYEKLAGMTGTASTEANEFMDIYGLDVVEIPTNVAGRPHRRARRDLSHGQGEVRRAIVAEIADCRRRGQPILVGTVSIEKSEQLSELLKDRKYIRSWGAPRWRRPRSSSAGKEGELKAYLADIGAYLVEIGSQAEGELRSDPAPGPERALPRAGGQHHRPGRRARRRDDRHQHGRPRHRHSARRQRRLSAQGLDCRGDSRPGARPIEAQIAKKRERLQADVAEKRQEALEAGGLYVLGTERHESRRIDNQLRGRSGRQGDPGRSKFYLSLEDDLMRIFGSERMDSVLKTLGLQEGEAITHPWMNKSLEMAQKKVEARNFDIRKQILKYDDVMNDQRKVIFEQRLDIMGERGRLRDGQGPAPPARARAGARSTSPRRPTPSSGTRRRSRRRSTASSASTCRSTSGPHEEGIADQEIERAAPQGGRREGRGQGARARARDYAPDREDGAAADARPPLARASRHAGAPAPGDRLPRLRPARSAQRVQERGLRAVRGDAGATCARP